MTLTNFPNGLTSFGALVGNAYGLPVSTNSTWYYVDAANGSDDNSGFSPNDAMATIAAAEDKCVANRHDAVIYIAGSSSNNLSATLTWDKNYTHFVGSCAPTNVAQRARIFQTSTATGLSPLLNITATGCIFKDFYIFQGVDDATSLINVQVTGGRNYFQNVHFAGGGHATQAINGGASLKLDAAEENLFVGCTIGVDTVDAATGMVGILFDSEAHRNEFRNCRIRMRAGNGGAAWAEVADATGIDRDTIFDNCIFLNNSGTALDSGFLIPAGMGAPRKLLLKDCMMLGSTKLDANDRGVLFGNMNAVTGADLSGVAVELKD
jgi:hypothetical protein